MYSVCIYIAKSGLSVLSMSMMVSKRKKIDGGWVGLGGWVGGWVDTYPNFYFYFARPLS